MEDSRKRETYKKLMRGLQNALAVAERLKRQTDTPIQEIILRLNAAGIDMSEEMILEDYSRLMDLEELSSIYLERYRDLFDAHEDDLINDDIPFILVQRIASEHFDAAATGDPSMITALTYDIYDSFPKPDQSEIEKLLQALITLSERRDVHLLSEAGNDFHMEKVVPELVRYCHDRNSAFCSLVRNIYMHYLDADPRMFPRVYEEAKNELKKRLG